MNTLTVTPWQHHPLGKIHFEPNKDMHLVCNPRDNHSIAVAINENDARLIAAAPDLLNALLRIQARADYGKDNPRKQTDVLFDILELSQDVIAKAIGENA